MNKSLEKELNSEIQTLVNKRNELDRQIQRVIKAKEMLLGSTSGGTTRKRTGEKNAPRGDNLRRVEEALAKNRQATVQQLHTETGVPVYGIRHAINDLRDSDPPKVKEIGRVGASKQKIWEYVGPVVPASNGSEDGAQASTEQPQGEQVGPAFAPST